MSDNSEEVKLVGKQELSETANASEKAAAVPAVAENTDATSASAPLDNNDQLMETINQIDHHIAKRAIKKEEASAAPAVRTHIYENRSLKAS